MGQKGSLPSNPRDEVRIAVRLHSVWDERLQASEEACRGRIVVEDSRGAQNPVLVFSQDRPAIVSVHRGSTLTFTVFAGRDGGAPIGQLVLPMQHAVQKCGNLLHHTWFLLDTHSIHAGAAQLADDVSAEQRFDQALRFAPRQMFQSKVCLSICGAQTQEVMSSVFEANATPEQRNERFQALSLCHRQHLQLFAVLQQHAQAQGQVGDHDPELEEQLERKREKVRLLKEQSLAQQTEIEVLEQAIQDTMKRQMSQSASGFVQAGAQIQEEIQALEQENRLLSQQLERTSAAAPAAGSWEEEKLRLQKEIVGVTEEANSRIDKANTSIMTLKDQIKTRQAEVNAVEDECKALERKLRQEEGELERLKIERGHSVENEDADKSALKMEIEVTTQQKEHLMRIVEDLYGSLGASNNDASASTTEPQQASGGGYPTSAAASVLTPEAYKDPAAGQGFLLPPPEKLVPGDGAGGGFKQF